MKKSFLIYRCPKNFMVRERKELDILVSGLENVSGGLERYLINWRMDELKTVDMKTRDLLTIYRALYQMADIDRLIKGWMVVEV